VWDPLIIYKSDWRRVDYSSLMNGRVPAIIFKNFYEKEYCKLLANRILSVPYENFQNGKLSHIGPFLMSYATKKKEYFEQAKMTQSKFDLIFEGLQRPTTRIFHMLEEFFPNYEIKLANESGKNFSPFVIRIHQSGKSIPLHKDCIGFEGTEYSISDIDCQLSCVLHIQKPKKGGDFVIYQRNWTRSDEKFRNIDFGYSKEIVTSENSCKISNIEQGDLVLIKPTQFHEVTTIWGSTTRITLGMFLGFFNTVRKIISWA